MKCFFRVLICFSLMLIISCESAINPRPVLIVTHGSQLMVNGSGSFDFGNQYYGTSSTQEAFIVRNKGKSDLLFLGSSVVKIIGSGSSSFVLDYTMLKYKVGPGKVTGFTIKFAPTGIGKKTAQVSINTNDTANNPYTFTVTGYCVKPTMEVWQESKKLTSGVSSYNFEKILNGKESEEVIFEIRNSGTGDLELTGESELISISGANEGDFIINQNTIESLIESGESTQFSIIFKPGSLGIKTAEISIANSDSSNNPFTFDLVGNSVACLTTFDFNNDNIDDVIVGANKADDGNTDSGCAFIFFGTESPQSNISCKNAGVIIKGESAGDWFAYCVSSAGDVNDDGIDDVIVGSYMDDDGGDKSGCAFIFFGSKNPSPVMSAASADVRIIGENSADYFGNGVSSAGDVNKDGIDDVIIGAPGSDSNAPGSGTVYIFYGKKNWSSILDASEANVKILGENENDMLGENVSNAGDINKDGFDDIITGSMRHSESVNGCGCAYVIFGKSNLSNSINASDADIRIVGKDLSGYLGLSTSNAGDFNNDGFDDIIIGAKYNTYGGSAKLGCSYIYYGKTSFASTLTPADADVTFVGNSEYGMFGSWVSSAGDFNKDGISDVIIGAEGDDGAGTDSGCAFVFCGSNNPDPMKTTNNATIKLIGGGAGDRFGRCVNTAGDFNNDDYSDVIVGAYSDNDPNTDAGCAFIFFGEAHPASAKNADSANVKMTGYARDDRFGWSVKATKSFPDHAMNEFVFKSQEHRMFDFLSLMNES